METPEGRLEDAFRDYRVRVRQGEVRIDALSTLRRAWHPLKEGLLGRADTAGIGVRWADGKELRLSVDVTKADQVHMMDEHLDGKQADLVEPQEAYHIGQRASLVLHHEQEGGHVAICPSA